MGLSFRVKGLEMKTKKHLYCCSSYYQLLVSLMKAMTQDRRIDLVLEEHGIETAGQLALRLESPQISCVDKVFVCPDSTKVDPYVQRCASFFPWQRRQILRHVDKVFGGTDIVARERYGRIHLFWDLGYMGTYCNIRRIHYTLHEDALNSYQHIRDNRKNYAYLFQKPAWKFFCKKHFGIGVIPFGYSRYCDRVEVNDRNGIDIPQDKVEEAPRAELELLLSDSCKKEISQLFLENLSLDAPDAAGAVLVLTEPFAVTGRLADKKAQIKLYRGLLKEYAQGKEVLIKPHPRDNLDYRKYFPEAKIIEKNIPMEVLNFCSGFQISKAVTVTSSVLQGIRCAGEKVYLGAEYLDKYKMDAEGD